MNCLNEPFLEKTGEENYKEYFKRLHTYFEENILNKFTINGMPVKVREYPPEGMQYEEAFYHLTCTDYEKQAKYRYPDFHRSKRLPVLRAILKNYDNCPTCLDLNDCGGILIWKKLFSKNNNYRFFLLFPEKEYLVILEERKDYYLLITAYYVKPLKMESFLEEYRKYQVDTI